MKTEIMKKKVYVFHCSSHKMKFGLTYDQTGSNLPEKACDGQWILYRVLTLTPDGPPIISGSNPKDILDELDSYGYIIQETRTSFR